MTHRIRSSVAALSVLAGLAVPSVAAAAAENNENLRCTGAVAGGIDNNVTVPAGYCSLTDVTARGNVTVEPNGGLDMNATGADSPLAQSPMTACGNLTVVGANAYADVNPGVVVSGTSTLFNADDL